MEVEIDLKDYWIGIGTEVFISFAILSKFHSKTMFSRDVGEDSIQ
jgi:hypothetical protein